MFLPPAAPGQCWGRQRGEEWHCLTLWKWVVCLSSSAVYFSLTLRNTVSDSVTLLLFSYGSGKLEDCLFLLLPTVFTEYFINSLVRFIYVVSSIEFLSQVLWEIHGNCIAEYRWQLYFCIQIKRVEHCCNLMLSASKCPFSSVGGHCIFFLQTWILEVPKGPNWLQERLRVLGVSQSASLCQRTEGVGYWRTRWSRPTAVETVGSGGWPTDPSVCLNTQNNWRWEDLRVSCWVDWVFRPITGGIHRVFVCLYACWCEQEGFCIPATGAGLWAWGAHLPRCLQLRETKNPRTSYWVNQVSKDTCHGVLLRCVHSWGWGDLHQQV